MRKNRLAFDVYGCKIRRADLHDLWQLCTKDFEKPSAILTVEDGISEIRSESLDSILEELGNPPRLSNLKINVSEAGDPLAESKGVWIDVDAGDVLQLAGAV